MTVEERIEKINFEQLCKDLYGHAVDIDFQKKRYIELSKEHILKFNNSDFDFYSSPGRIEVCGNHTDHNNGKVICASINVDTLGCVTKTNDSKIIIASVGYPDVVVNINDLEINKKEFGNSSALARGVVAYYKSKGYKVGGFNATTTSTLFKGAGVSSSACFCLLVAEVLNQYFNDGKISFIEKAKASQYAENDYFGKPCGLMDQMAISAGGVIFIDFKDTANPEVERINWAFDDVDIVLINTGGNHSKLTDEYADIRKDMSAVANCFGEKTLRFVDEDKFYQSLDELQKEVSGRAILRTMHFFNENRRVENAVTALKNKSKEQFVKQIQESGNSSNFYLQNVMPKADVAQRISLALGITENCKIPYLARRVHGGGFMGTVLIMIDKNYTQQYMKLVSKVFGGQNVFLVNIRNAGAKKIEA